MLARLQNYEVVALGTAGWIPAGTRETNCLAVKTGDALFFFDVGTGLRRLMVDPARNLLDGELPIYVFLSHFHLDHVIGVSFFPLIFRHRTVTILGPGKEISGCTTAEALTQLCSRPLFPSTPDRFPLNLTIGDLHAGENEVGGHLVRTIRQRHADPSVGIRLDETICYVTDTACAEQTATFAKDAELLFHECWLDRAGHREALQEPGSPVLETHCHVDGVSSIATQAGAGKLVLIHLNPVYDALRLEAMLREAREGFPETVLGHDLQSYSVH